MRVLMIGDIVGAPGRRAVRELLPGLRTAHRLDAVVANAENAAGGRGITPALADELLGLGIDVLTLGDHVWDQKEIAHRMRTDPRLVRPANLAPQCPGRGWHTVATPAGPLTVTCLLGRVFLPPVADCPFRGIDALLGSLPAGHGPIIVDVHAEATSEKIALGWHLDGRASLVAGTHTHVQTADEQILPKGTAYITDLGMTGPKHSVIGREIQSVLGKFITGMPSKFEVAADGVSLEGVVVEINPAGRAEHIERIREPLHVPAA